MHVDHVINIPLAATCHFKTVGRNTLTSPKKVFSPPFNAYEKSEYDQEIPQSHTADQPTAP